MKERKPAKSTNHLRHLLIVATLISMMTAYQLSISHLSMVIASKSVDKVVKDLTNEWSSLSTALGFDITWVKDNQLSPLLIEDRDALDLIVQGSGVISPDGREVWNKLSISPYKGPLAWLPTDTDKFIFAVGGLVTDGFGFDNQGRIGLKFHMVPPYWPDISSHETIESGYGLTGRLIIAD